MKVFWSLVAVLLGCLALGGLMSAVKGGGWFDLVIAAGLAWAAVGVWKSARS